MAWSIIGNKAVVCALSASYISTFAGYPVRLYRTFSGLAVFSHKLVAWQLDSLKSRLQTQKTPISVPRIALLVYREEGIIGFYRGLWIPLMTISFVRTCLLLASGGRLGQMMCHRWQALRRSQSTPVRRSFSAITTCLTTASCSAVLRSVGLAARWRAP